MPERENEISVSIVSPSSHAFVALVAVYQQSIQEQ